MLIEEGKDKRSIIEKTGNKQKLAQKLASLTEGYSGSDLKEICRRALMRPIREAIRSNCDLSSARDIQLEDFVEVIQEFESNMCSDYQ